mmetsp:Transcript_56286/g.174508  ORF Transcript_56286/g.174508 Transcript_56286/m.174508 type:complete len:385 (+) Transcript_56286:93-1247(+)
MGAGCGRAVPYEDIDDLALQFVGIWNPQHAVQTFWGPEPGEAALLRAVCRWLDARQIAYESDVTWGVHAVLESPAGPPEKPGVLLAAHLDSDHLAGEEAMSSLSLDRARRELTCEGEVGLDDKSGVAIVLSVVERLRAGHVRGVPPRWSLHLLFTVGEESGQKGALRAPLPRLLAGRVRHGVVVDRRTAGPGAPAAWGRCMRHVVSAYRGVQLLDPRCGEELLQLLGRGLRFAGEQADDSPPPAVASPNCSDALELRGRWDAEVLGPWVLAQKQGSREDLEELKAALKQYEQLTKDVLKRMEAVEPQRRVSSMSKPPRVTRYNAMARIYELLHSRGGLRVDPGLCFSCVNLSYDYQDGRPCSIAELERTANALVGFVAAYFEGA